MKITLFKNFDKLIFPIFCLRNSSDNSLSALGKIIQEIYVGKNRKLTKTHVLHFIVLASCA